MKNVTQTFLPTILLVFFAFGNAFAAQPKDSIGVEIINGKKYILHKVDKGQTLFAVARKYKASVAEIKAANPALEKGFQADMVLKVPSTRGTSAKTAPQPTNPTATKAAAGKAIAKPKFHVVLQGQSAFSISKTYKITVEELKAWNNVGKKDIKVGDRLVIYPTGYKPEAIAAKEEISIPAKQQVQDGGSVIEVSQSGFERVREKGFAEMIEEETESKTHLCLHKTAPAGTVLLVKNAINGNQIYMRVVGKLPELGDKTVLIRVSKKAFETLGADNKRFPVEISYSQAEEPKQ